MEYSHGYYAGAGADFSKQEKKKFAKEFAEGSKELEALLLNLWNNGIDTISCCAGHDDTGFELKPYISISMKTLDDGQLKYVLKKLYELKRKKIIEGVEVEADLYDNEKIERHMISVVFAKCDENNFKLLNKIFSFEDQKTISLLSFKERDFIKAAIKINSLDLTKYAETNPPKDKSYSMIEIDDSLENEGKLVLRTNDRMYRQSAEYNNFFVVVAEGYASRVEETGEYVTLKDRKVVPISQEQAKKLPLFKRDKTQMMKYCVIKEFKSGQFQRDVINEIEDTIKKHEQVAGI